MIIKPVLDELRNLLQLKLNTSIDILKVTRISGGDINDCYKVQSSNGDYFLKVNDANLYPDLFQAEMHGLHLLAFNSSFSIPESILQFEIEDHCALLLPYIQLKSKGDWSIFGKSLAELHQVSASYFGLERANYIGSLQQSNKPHDSWASFYREERILPLFKIAFDRGLFDRKDLKMIDQVCHQFDTMFPIEKPTLLHGDLWIGNAAFNKGRPCIYDPAVYFGHREMDLGMTLLFGGFPKEMYESYEEIYPIEKGWKERIHFTQLYPLLVHVNLFGASYSSQVKSILKRS